MTKNSQQKQRLYFTCPIKAAYMAKEFGVIIHGLMKNKARSPLSSDWEQVINFRCGKMYVAKESESVFLRNKDEIVNEKHFFMSEVGDE